MVPVLTARNPSESEPGARPGPGPGLKVSRNRGECGTAALGQRHAAAGDLDQAVGERVVEHRVPWTVAPPRVDGLRICARTARNPIEELSQKQRRGLGGYAP